MNMKTFTRWVALSLIGMGPLLLAPAVSAAEVNRKAEMPVRPALTPLAPDAVEPQGWLRDWALAARDGITGHLDQWHPTFRDSWKGIPVNGPGAAPDGTGWPLEQGSYWLDGLLRLGCILHDEELIRKATARLALVVDGVNAGGKSFIYWRKDRPDGFNSWAHSQMGRALVAWYEATGEKRVLDALVAAYRDYPVPMGHLCFDNTSSSGLCNADAMLETYTFSGDQRILDRCERPSTRRRCRQGCGDGPSGSSCPVMPPALMNRSGYRLSSTSAPASQNTSRHRLTPSAGSTRTTCSLTA